MKTNIILSGLTAAALLLSGCTDDQKTALDAALNKANTANVETQETVVLAENNAGSQSRDSVATSNGSTNTEGTVTGSTEVVAGSSSNTGTVIGGSTTGSVSTGNSNNGNTNGGSTGGSNSDNDNSTGDSETGSSDNGDTDTSTSDNTTGDGDTDNGNSGDDLIPGEGNGADIPTQTGKAGGWYGRTVVSATAADGTVYTHSTAGIFGELVDSNEAVDQHDIPGFGAAALQVVFPQGEEGSTKDFFSNYQSFDSGDKKIWEFQIKNQITVDLASVPISIESPVIKKVTYKKVKGQIIYGEETVDNTKAAELTLIDVDNATSYTVGQLATANLTMAGQDDCPLHTRTFKWVLGAVTNDDYTSDIAAECSPTPLEEESGDVNIARSININTITADGFDTASVKTAQAGGKFGLPPM